MFSKLLFFVYVFTTFTNLIRSDDLNVIAVDDIRKQLIASVSAQNIRSYLKQLTRKPHLSGTAAEDETASFVHDTWTRQGLDSVHLVNYSVLLSYPNPDKPNIVKRLNATGHTIFQSQGFEEPLNATDEQRPYYFTNPPFLAYSPNTDKPVTGDLVYVNYGGVDDYKLLKTRFGVNATGKIVLVRYGKSSRSTKVAVAQMNGAVGIIIYSDPADYTNTERPDFVYPESMYLPETGVQRGNIKKVSGDPRTPGYPAKESAYRLPMEQVKKLLPQIPAHCVSYSTARHLLRGLKGSKAPKAWTGALPMPYHIGPGHSDGSRISIEVNVNLTQRNITNVIGVIKGKTEPDRLVIVGNHRDAWTFGATDPSSGTASMLAMSEAMTKAMKSMNWRPRRTVVFASWAAEEYGLIGSNEWVEENLKILQAQAIAYLNVDLAVMGNITIGSRSTPMMYRMAWDAAKQIPNPNREEVAAGRPTVYDSWVHDHSWNSSEGPVPVMPPSGSRSDHVKFVQLAGVPVFDFRYRCARKFKWNCNALYHTMYETFELQDRIMDKDFKFNKAIAQFWAEMTRSLADSEVLPLSVEFYPKALKEGLATLKRSNFMKCLTVQNITLGALDEAIENFQQAVNEFTSELKKVDTKNILAVRRINDILMLLERSFVDPNGVPLTNASLKHLISAPTYLDAAFDKYYPGLYNLVWQAENGNDKPEQWQLVKKHVAVIVYHIDSAARLLRQQLF